MNKKLYAFIFLVTSLFTQTVDVHAAQPAQRVYWTNNLPIDIASFVGGATDVETFKALARLRRVSKGFNCGALSAMKELFKKESPDDNGLLLLHHFADKNNFEACSLILENATPQDVRFMFLAQDTNSDTPLHYAVAKGDWKLVLYLVEVAQKHAVYPTIFGMLTPSEESLLSIAAQRPGFVILLMTKEVVEAIRTEGSPAQSVLLHVTNDALTGASNQNILHKAALSGDAGNMVLVMSMLKQYDSSWFDDCLREPDSNDRTPWRIAEAGGTDSVFMESYNRVISDQ